MLASSQMCDLPLRHRGIQTCSSEGPKFVGSKQNFCVEIVVPIVLIAAVCQHELNCIIVVIIIIRKKAIVDNRLCLPPPSMGESF